MIDGRKAGLSSTETQQLNTTFGWIKHFWYSS